jgi:hypothetical protein
MYIIVNIFYHLMYMYILVNIFYQLMYIYILVDIFNCIVPYTYVHLCMKTSTSEGRECGSAFTVSIFFTWNTFDLELHMYVHLSVSIKPSQLSIKRRNRNIFLPHFLEEETISEDCFAKISAGKLIWQRKSFF